jgi:hypothetical protein
MTDENDPTDVQGENRGGHPPGEKPAELAPNARRMTEAEYNAIYQAWKGGLRNSVHLGAKFGWSDETIRQLVKKGNVRRSWLSFEKQLLLDTESMREAKLLASEKIADRAADAWDKAKAVDLALINGNKRMVSEMIQRFMRAVETVKFDGMSGVAACTNARALAAAIDLLVKAESLLLGKATERKEISAGDGWDKLTPEQATYIVEHGGQLPPDVNEDVLYGGAEPSN